MKHSLAAALFAALLPLVKAQALINSPDSLEVCRPTSLQISGGQAPYFVSVIPGGEPGAAALRDLPTQNAAGSFTWTVDLPAGTEISFRIRDGTGALNFSSKLVIQSSTDTSCLGGNGSLTTSVAPTDSSISSAPGTTSLPVTSTPPSTASSRSSAPPTTASGATTGRTTTTGATTTSAAPTPSDDGAAGKLNVQYVGAALAAVAAALIVVA